VKRGSSRSRSHRRLAERQPIGRAAGMCGQKQNRTQSDVRSPLSARHQKPMTMAVDELVLSDSPTHPANLICELCRLFYGTLINFRETNFQGNGWVTGTGGGMTIRDGCERLHLLDLILGTTYSLPQVEFRKRYHMCGDQFNK